MQVTAQLRYARISPQKCRLVADLVRGKPVGNAIATLKYLPKKGAELVRKVLESWSTGEVDLVAAARIARNLRECEVMMVLTAAQERHLVFDVVGHCEADDIGVEANRCRQVTDVENGVAQATRARSACHGRSLL